MLEQDANRAFAAARLRRQVEGGNAAGGRHRSRVSARAQERAHHVRMPRPAGQVQGRVFTDPRCRPGLGPGADQDVHDFQVTLARGQVQRGQAVSLRQIGVGPILKQSPHRVRVPPPGRIQQPVLRRRGPHGQDDCQHRAGTSHPASEPHGSLRVLTDRPTGKLSGNSPVLSPKARMSSCPRRCIRLTNTLAMGVPFGARRCRLPSSAPFA